MISIKSWSLDIRPDYHIEKTEDYGSKFQRLEISIIYYNIILKKNLIQPLDKK